MPNGLPSAGTYIASSPLPHRRATDASGPNVVLLYTCARQNHIVLLIPVRLHGRQATQLAQAAILDARTLKSEAAAETKSRRIPNYIDVNVLRALKRSWRGNRTNLAYSHLLGAGTYLTNLFKSQNLHLAHWDKVCTEIKQIVSPAPASTDQFSCPSEETSQAVPRHESVSQKVEQPAASRTKDLPGSSADFSSWPLISPEETLRDLPEIGIAVEVDGIRDLSEADYLADMESRLRQAGIRTHTVQDTSTIQPYLKLEIDADFIRSPSGSLMGSVIDGTLGLWKRFPSPYAAGRSK